MGLLERTPLHFLKNFTSVRNYINTANSNYCLIEWVNTQLTRLIEPAVLKLNYMILKLILLVYVLSKIIRICVCLSGCNEGFRCPLNQYTPFQCTISQNLGRFIAILGQGTNTLPREVAHRKNDRPAPVLRHLIYKKILY